MDNKETLQTYNARLGTNNTALDSVLEAINNLPEGFSGDYNDLTNQPITQLTGTESEPIYLRTLQTGAYKLNGVCSPYEGSEVYMNANNSIAYVAYFETVTAVQLFYPPYNQVQYFEIYDNNYTTNTVALNDMATKLAGIEENANNYSLPIASASKLGGVKIGSNLEITDDGTLNALSSQEIKTISGEVDISTLSEGIYINNSDVETYLVYSGNEDETTLRKGTIVIVTKVSTTTMCKIIGYDLMYQLVCKNDTMNRIEYATVISVEEAISNVSGGTGNVSSDIVNSIKVVDVLPEIEEEGVLYLVKEIEVEEPTIEYVTNPTMEMGSISRDGTLSDSTEYCRTADYVYVYGKNSVTITNGTGNPSRITCYDANKNFLANWFVDTDGTSYSYRNVDDGSSMVIPEGCYYIKVRITATEVKPITIQYND